MQLWDKILQLALLGSERSHLEPAVEVALRQYRIDPEDPLPEVILSGAAALHQLRRLRIPSEPFRAALPKPLDHEEDDPTTLSPDSLLHLKQMTSGRYRRALPEFIRRLATAQRSLPPEFLPELLNDCLQDSRLWEDLQPLLLGARATWLMAGHPQWWVLRPQADPSRWEDADREERKKIVSCLRRKDPPAAITLLKGNWKKLAYPEKLDFLALLPEGLGAWDEPFLENALEDRRKEVRLKAADLLAGISGSRLVSRLFEQLHPLFSYDPSKEWLKVDLPREIPAATARDGILPKVRKGRSGGLKAGWLFKCVARIPLAYWLAHFHWTAEALFRAFDTSKRANLLLAALGEAVLRFREEESAADLLRYLALQHRPVPEQLNWQELSKLAPAAAMQKLADDYFRAHSGLLEEKHLLTRLLTLGHHPWSAATARQVVEGLKEWMATSKTFLWNLWHYKGLLEAAGYCSPPSLLDELGSNWPVSSPVWNQWAPDVDRMLKIMRFRAEAGRAIER